MRLLLLLLLLAPQASAQLTESAAAELQQMAAHAGVIFTGQVAEVSRNDPAGFVDIRFRVDHCVRGCKSATHYVVREWAGLWTANPDRYRTGDLRLMLLSSRSAAGFSSPVGGADGAIPLLPAGVEPLANPIPPADLAPTPAALTVDLRWIQARTPRTLAASTPGGLATSHRALPAGSQPVPLPAVLALFETLRGPTDARF